MTKAHDLAGELERACGDFADYVAGLDPEDWRRPAANHPDISEGSDERRSVGVVAHHVGDQIPLLAEIARRRACGEQRVPVSPADIDALNARHAASNPEPDQAETASLIRDNGERAADLIRELDDSRLDRAGPDELTAAEVVRRVLVGHVAWHAASIRAAVEQRAERAEPGAPATSR